MKRCINNPMKVVHAVHNLGGRAEAAGVLASFKTDLQEFVEVRHGVRQ